MASSQRIIKALGAVVREARREKGLTQEKLAFEAHLNKNHIAKVEQGRTSASFVVVFAIAEALGLQPNVLTGRVEKVLKNRKP